MQHLSDPEGCFFSSCVVVPRATLTLDGEAELVCHVPDLADGVREVVVLLQEVEGAQCQQLKGDAHVAVVVEPVKHLDA